MNHLALVAIGLLTAGALAWVCVAAPDRVVIPVGWGLLGAIAAGVVGTIIGASRYGVPDGSSVLIGTVQMHWAGYGWLLGSCLGLVAARRLPPASRGQAWAFRSLAVAAIPIGILATRFQATRVVPCGFGQTVLAGLQRATLVNAASVALILLLVAGVARNRAPVGPENLNVVARWGIALGVFATIVIVLFAWQLPSGNERGRAYGARSFCLRGSARSEAAGGSPTGAR